MANGMDECSFCSELYDADELIEVKDSLVKLKSGFKEFSEVIANVYMSKVDHLGLICLSCKAQILNFYNFKQKTRDKVDDIWDDNKILVIEEVKKFLANAEERLEVHLRHDKSLSIIPVAERCHEEIVRYVQGQDDIH